MIETIQQIDGWQDMTAEAIAAELGEIVPVSDSTSYVFSDLEDTIGEADALTVLATMDAARSDDPRVGLAMTALGSSGLRLDLPSRQQTIEALAVAGSWPDTLRDSVKALGVRQVPRWETLGGSGDVPDAPAVQAELDAFAAEETMRARVDAVTQARATVEQAIGEGLTTTEQQAADLFAAELSTYWPGG